MTFNNNVPSRDKVLLLSIALVVLFGSLLRTQSLTAFRGLGFDENYYRLYLTALDSKGLAGYPELARGYVHAQEDMPAAVIPPTRAVFLVSAFLWQKISGDGPLVALHLISCWFTVLSLIVTAVFVARMSGLAMSLAVSSLMACAPMQLQMSQRIYIDGVFSFWALLTLWLLWECLQAPAKKRWLISYGTSVALMVMTKENAAFVFAAILAILLANRWLRFGKVTRWLLLATFLGATLGGLMLVLAAGGVHTLFQVFALNMSKSYAIPYVVKTGDGPWFRYVLDLMTMSPAVTLLAIAAFLTPRVEDRPRTYFAIFIGVSYLLMANIKYGINLRYGTIWDMPMRWLAASHLFALAAFLPPRWARWFVPVAVIAVCGIELHQFDVLFVQHHLYDPVPEPMLRALQILK